MPTNVALPLPDGNFAAYLFDLDGTVADTMPLHLVSWQQAVAEQGGTFPEDLFYALGGVPLPRTVEILNETFGTTMDPAAVAHRKEQLYLADLEHVAPVASVLAHVERSFGTIPFAIVSGSPRASIVKTLAVLGLTDRFPVLVGAEDYAKGKPDPEPFLTAARLLGVAPERCLVFEDADAGIEAAKAAGMQWVRVPGPRLDCIQSVPYWDPIMQAFRNQCDRRRKALLHKTDLHTGVASPNWWVWDAHSTVIVSTDYYRDIFVSDEQEPAPGERSDDALPKGCSVVTDGFAETSV